MHSCCISVSVDVGVCRCIPVVLMYASMGGCWNVWVHSCCINVWVDVGALLCVCM